MQEKREKKDILMSIVIYDNATKLQSIPVSPPLSLAALIVLHYCHRKSPSNHDDEY